MSKKNKPAAQAAPPAITPLAEVPTGLPPQPDPPPRWEYKSEWLPDATWDREANRLGADGWELVGVLREEKRSVQREVVEGQMTRTEWFPGRWCAFKRRVA